MEERNDIVRSTLKLNYHMDKIVQEIGGTYSVAYNAASGLWEVLYFYTFNSSKHTTLMSFDYNACNSKQLRDMIVQRLYACMCHIFLDVGKEL